MEKELSRAALCLAVVGRGLLADDHQVPGQNARVLHGVTPHPQSKICAAVAAHVEGQVVLDALLGQNGRAGGHIAHDGHPVHPFLPFSKGRGLPFVHRRVLQIAQRPDGAAFAGAFFDIALVGQIFQVEVNGGRRFQAHRIADLAHGRRISLLFDALNDVAVDLHLHGFMLHGASSLFL